MQAITLVSLQSGSFLNNGASTCTFFTHHQFYLEKINEVLEFICHLSHVLFTTVYCLNPRSPKALREMSV